EFVGVESFARRDCSDSVGRTVEDSFGRFTDERRSNRVDVSASGGPVSYLVVAAEAHLEQEHLRRASALVEPRRRRCRIMKITKRSLVEVAVQRPYPMVSRDRYDLRERDFDDILTAERLGKLEHEL